VGSANYEALHYSVFSSPLLHLPQHPIREHSQPVLLPQIEREIFTRIEKRTRKIAILYKVILIFFIVAPCILFETGLLSTRPPAHSMT